MPTRRSLLIGTALALPALRMRAFAAEDPVEVQLSVLEAGSGGRLGVTILDTATGTRRGYRQDERFPMCSTFKFLATALVLSRVDRGEESLDRRIVFAKSDLVTYSPVTQDRVGPPGMTIAEFCEAMMTVSDNTAANLMLASFGGPAGFTAYARSLGDEVTRLDRIETELNEALPGDPRDTTSPAAMAGNLQKVVLGDALSPASRDTITAWLVANKTGDERLRAGVPAGWQVGDKTGTGMNGATNDIGVIWPPGRAPLIVTVYSMSSTAPSAARSAVIAEVARIATRDI